MSEVAAPSDLPSITAPFERVFAVGAIAGLLLGLSIGLGFLAPDSLPQADRIAIASAQNDGFASGFLAACGSPCFVRDNYGGRLNDYLALADQINRRERPVVIMGACISACAVMADVARKHVRIARSARFEFHRASDERNPPHSYDLLAWAAARGGFPSNDSGATLKMQFDQARHFWRPQTDRLAIPRRLDAPLDDPIDFLGLRRMQPSLRLDQNRVYEIKLSRFEQ